MVPNGDERQGQVLEFKGDKLKQKAIDVSPNRVHTSPASTTQTCINRSNVIQADRSIKRNTHEHYDTLLFHANAWCSYGDFNPVLAEEVLDIGGEPIQIYILAQHKNTSQLEQRDKENKYEAKYDGDDGAAAEEEDNFCVVFGSTSYNLIYG
eukprot:852899_1